MTSDPSEGLSAGGIDGLDDGRPAQLAHEGIVESMEEDVGADWRACSVAHFGPDPARVIGGHLHGQSAIYLDGLGNHIPIGTGPRNGGRTMQFGPDTEFQGPDRRGLNSTILHG